MDEKDIFRLEYYELTEAQKIIVKEIKKKAKELLDVINSGKAKANYEFAKDFKAIELSAIKLEECVMWAVKGNTEKTYQ